MATIPLPREHGAWLTLAGAAAAALLAGAQAAPAFGATLVLAAAFALRRAGDRLATGRPLRRSEWLAVGAMLGIGLGAIALAPSLAAAGVGIALVIASAVARRARRQRDLAVEILAMSALGGAAGVIAAAGGVPALDALALAIALGAHAASSVPLVHARLRGLAAAELARAARHAAAILGLAMLCLVLLWRPIAGVALAPRALAILGLATARPPVRPARIGVEEVVLLIASILLASWAVRVLLASAPLASWRIS